jgi:type I restriction enzyme S subunit
MSKMTDWQTITIKEIYKGLYDGPHATPKPSDEGPVFLGIKNVTDDGQLDLTTIRHIAESEFGRWTKRVEPRVGDIVFTYEATLNRYAIIPEGFRGCLGRRMALIRPNVERIDIRFLHFYFFSKAWRDVIRHNTLTGATVDRIPLTTFPDFPITIPSLPSQRKIAGILSAYDDLIENNLRRISILEEMAQSLYREWFVHFRFPGHEDVAMVDSPLGPIPGGWEVKKILDFADVIYGYSFKSKQFNTSGDGEPVVRIRDVLKGRSETFTLEEGDPKHRIENGDILVGMDGDFHMSIWSGGEAWQNQRVAKFRSKGGIGINLLFRILQAPIQFFNATITGTTVAHLGDKHIKTIQFAAPPTNLLLHASEIFEPFATEQLNLKQRNQNLRQTRDLLLPKLLSPSV